MNNTQKLMNEYRKHFHLAYHSRILPLLLRFEPKRKKYLILTLLAEFVIIGFIIWAILRVGAFGAGDVTRFWCIVIGVGVSVMFILPPIVNKKFSNELKKYCLKPILDIFGSINWRQNIIKNSELEKSELFAIFNKRTTDDGFEGEFKGVKFEIAETYLAYESGSGKNRNTRKVFDGVVIKFASNKKNTAKTMIATKGDQNIKRGGILSAFLIIISFAISVLCSTGFERMIILGVSSFLAILILVGVLTNKDNKDILKPIHLEDPVFNRKFKVYSTNEVECRYLITTAFMERFLNIKTAFGAKNAKCAFYDDVIMFAISTNKNLFEIGSIYSKLGNSRQLDKFFNEFASILLLVEHFKLDQKIGL